MIATLFQVNAQRERGRDFSPENQADRMTERMSERLGLNEAQQKEIHALHLEHAQKRKKEMEERKEAMEAMKAEREAHEAKINEILTPEQREKWEAMRQENRQRINEGRRSPEKRMMNRGAREGNRPG